MSIFQDYISNFTKFGFVIKKMKNPDLVAEVQKIIKDDFKEDNYLHLDNDEYREKILISQKKINKLNFQLDFVKNEIDFLNELISNQLHLQNVVYLRAARPMLESFKQEQLGFHRETFYSDHEYMKYQHNIWVPILNVTEKNCLSYVEKSHLIPDDKIKTESIKEEKSGVKRFSNGHKVGLAYMPKKIISGVNFDLTKKLYVPDGHFVVFSSMLIHGAAVNFEKAIRFSLDFGVLPSEKLTDIKFSFAAGKPQFSSLSNF